MNFRLAASLSRLSQNPAALRNAAVVCLRIFNNPQVSENLLLASQPKFAAQSLFPSTTQCMVVFGLAAGGFPTVSSLGFNLFISRI
jgi:hypothetical protein